MPASIAWRTWTIAALGFAPFTVAGGLESPSQPMVQAVRIDGTTIHGAWAGISDGLHVQVGTADGVQAHAIDSLLSLTFEGTSDDKAEDSPSVAIHLADGGVLHGELATADAAEHPMPADGIDAIVATTALGINMPFAFDRLAGVRLGGPEAFPRAHSLFASALEARQPGHDVLITRSADDPRSVRGRLETLNGAGGSFHTGDRGRRFTIDKVYAIVFAGSASREARGPGRADPPAVYSITVQLHTGSTFSGRFEPLESCVPAATTAAQPVEVRGSAPEARDPNSICVATSVGPRAALAIDAVSSIQVHSPRVVYISDLAPRRKQEEGIVHRSVSGQPPWPMRNDQSVTGGPLASGGRGFSRGLGVHSRTELEYGLGGAYEKFVATIGVDDAVQPRGSVVFRVLGDGKMLFESGILTGTDPPRDAIVPIVGVTSLTLVVDYGDELDVADAAVWGDARLLKPAGAAPAAKKSD